MYRMLIVFALFLSACNNNKAVISETYNNFINKSLYLPQKADVTYNVDTTFSDSRLMVVAYVSNHCLSCIADEIYEWDGFSREFEGFDNISFRLYVSVNEIRELDQLLKEESFTVPVFLDENDSFFKKNNLSNDSRFHTFLLLDDKIKLIGSPLNNGNLKTLYYDFIFDNLKEDSSGIK